MASEVRSIEFTIVNSEFDALLLENSLIKKNQPRYNILLKDDKSYPYILLTNERFPAHYPHPPPHPRTGPVLRAVCQCKGHEQHSGVAAIISTKFVPVATTCRKRISRKASSRYVWSTTSATARDRARPCSRKTSYNADIEQATNILKGNLGVPRTYFREKMQEAAENLEFERAQQYKLKTELLAKYQAKSLVVNDHIGDTDVFTIVSDDQMAFVNYLKANKGAIVLTKTIEVKKKLDESDEDILALIMVELRERYRSTATEVITNIEMPVVIEGVAFTIPKIGDKRKLVDMSIKNALYYKRERFNRVQDNKQRISRVVLKLQEDLRLKVPPVHLECFDNSNMQGTHPVASMVCFKNGRPSKKDYRKFNIKTVVGPDDFASMYEIVFRRYKRLLDEEIDLPNLIVIDGGKGQLSAACQALKDLGIYGDIPIIGIAKRLEEIYRPEDPYPLHIDKKSESLKLIQRARDEAHRFAITFHRQKRSNAAFRSELEDIKGIGKKTAMSLLKNFKSVKRIKEAEEEELASLVGPVKARALKEALADKVLE